MKTIIDAVRTDGKFIEVSCQGITYKSVTGDDILDFMRVIFESAGIKVTK